MLSKFIAFREFNANFTALFVSTFNFPPLQRKPKKIKRASKAPLGFSADTSATMTVLCINAGVRASGNSTYPKVAVSRSEDTFVVAESSFLRINICGKNRHLRVAANR